MKKKKIAFCFAMILFIFMGVLKEPVTIEAKTKNGFTYDEKEFNVKWTDYQKLRVDTDEGKKLGTMSYLTGIAREKGANDYLIMFKEIMTPNDKKVKINYLNQKGYGMSEYMSLKATLPSLNDYKPQNDPKTDSIDIGIGIDKDGPSISAQYKVKTNELDITSKCNTPKNLYYVVYDYKPHIPNVFASNKYLANESVQMGIAEIETKKKKITFSVDYEARFGASEDKGASPASVYVDYVRKNKKTRKYTYTLAIN